MANSNFRKLEADFIERIRSIPNLIGNGNFEENSVGVTLYDDGAVAAPIDMTGGAPAQISVALTQNAGDVLYCSQSLEITKAAADAQGEGLAFTCSVPEGYRGERFLFSMPYKVNTGSIANDLIKVYVYDITNATVITPTMNSVFSSRGEIAALFSIPSTCASFRIGLHFATTDATAATISIDAVFCGPLKGIDIGVASQPSGPDVTSNITLTPADNGRVVSVDSSGGPIGITMPPFDTVDNFVFSVKDTYGNASTNNISILPSNVLTETTDGSLGATVISTDYECITVQISNGAARRISSFVGTAVMALDRAVFGGGINSGTRRSIMEFISFTTAGSTQTFGSLPTARYGPCGFASSTRGVFAGGNEAGNVSIDDIDFITIAILSNSSTFGIMTGVSTENQGGASNATTGVIFGGNGFDIIHTVTIASTGNSATFGTVLTATRGAGAGSSNQTRAVYAGGFNTTNTVQIGVIEYIDYAVAATVSGWGAALTVSRAYVTGASDNNRAVFAGGDASAPKVTIDYLDYATLATVTNFGNLLAGLYGKAGASNNTIAIFATGSNVAGTPQTSIDQVTIQTTANSTSFGTMTTPSDQLAGLSNVHGGL